MIRYLRYFQENNTEALVNSKRLLKFPQPLQCLNELHHNVAFTSLSNIAPFERLWIIGQL